jgi:undecaprenyl-diphosphatase
LERETAARYSFLLSIPAIIGAEGLALKAGLENGVHVNLPMVLGTLSAFVVGYLSLVWLLKMVRHGQLHLFTPYCWILGTGAIVLGWG